MEPFQRFTTFDGLQLAYTTGGTGPDVLLLHGFASSATGNWIQPGIADAIVASGRHVIAYDARGHGQSDKPHDQAAYENNAMVRDAQALLDALGVARVDIVGYSMGAIVSSRLVPVEPRARSLVLGGIGGNLAAGRRSLPRDRIADALSSAGGMNAINPAARAFRRFAERAGNDLQALSAVQRAAAHGSMGKFGEINVPTLVVAGADDRLAGDPAALAARIPGAVAQVVPGNHLSAVVKPELRNAIVSFLQRIPA
jgi:pimeloyl-ACP methyl ester carboxylesterase